MLDSKVGMSLLLLAHGAALDATSRMRYIHPPTAAGVKKKWILDPSLVCPHIHVVRHAHGLVRAARIRAILPVTQVLVPPVHPWDQLRIVFAVGIPPPNVARIPIMSKDGAVGRSVVTCFRVVNTPALFHVMRACVVPARSP